jgi:splicing factor 3A subunit 1
MGAYMLLLLLARLGVAGPQVNEPTQICPRCQQAIPVSEMDEHVRIELLDPRWKEQKQAAEAKLRGSNLTSEGRLLYAVG